MVYRYAIFTTVQFHLVFVPVDSDYWLNFPVCCACAGQHKRQVKKKEKKNRREEYEDRKKVTRKTKKEHKRKKQRRKERIEKEKKTEPRSNTAFQHQPRIYV